MKALILAGGRSTRLYPRTRYTPKCLLRLDEKRILDHQMLALAAYGITDVTIVVGCHGGKIKRYLEAEYPAMRFTFVENSIYAKTNAIYSLWLARHVLEGEESVLFFHADVAFEPAVLGLLTDKERSSRTLLLYRPGETDEEAGKIIVDAHQRVLRLGKKLPLSEASGEYLQIARFERPFMTALLHHLRRRIEIAHEYNLYTIDVYNDVVQDPSVQAYAVDVGALKIAEVDTEADLLYAQRLFS